MAPLKRRAGRKGRAGIVQVLLGFTIGLCIAYGAWMLLVKDHVPNKPIEHNGGSNRYYVTLPEGAKAPPPVEGWHDRHIKRGGQALNL